MNSSGSIYFSFCTYFCVWHKCLFFKVQLSNNKKEVGNETLFKVFCPGQYGSFPHKLKMYQNGSVHNDIKYEDICSDMFVTNVAYTHIANVAYTTYVNGTIHKPPPGFSIPHALWIGKRSQIPYTFEILLPFFKHNNIFAIGINCNGEFGHYDLENETFTGCYGKV